MADERTLDQQNTDNEDVLDQNQQKDTQTTTTQEPQEWWEEVPEDYRDVVKNYKTKEDFYKAHKELLAEFTRKSQRLKELEDELVAGDLWKQILNPQDENKEDKGKEEPSEPKPEKPVPQEGIPEQVVNMIAATKLEVERMNCIQEYPDFKDKFSKTLKVLKRKRGLIIDDKPLETAYLIVKGLESVSAAKKPPDLEKTGKAQPPTAEQQKTDFEKLIDEALKG